MRVCRIDVKKTYPVHAITIHMKTITVLFILLTALTTAGQNNPVIRPRTNPAPKPVTVSGSNDCKMISGTEIATRLLAAEFRSVSARIDHETGFFRVGNSKLSFKIQEQKINKPGYNWVYQVNDINSIRHRFVFEKNAFWLQLDFESDGSEIKGTCPGCRDRFEDRRAPDLHWKGPNQIFIRLKPVIYQQSVAFEAEEVNVLGKFEINGPSDLLLPMLNSLEWSIRKEMEKQIKKYLNSAIVKRRISEIIKPIILAAGIVLPDKIYSTDGQLFICGRTTTGN